MGGKEKETVNKQTFKKWDFGPILTFLRADDDGNLRKLQCKICSAHLGDILREAKHRSMKGVAMHGITNLAEGLESVHRGNLYRHIKSGSLHDWAKRKLCVSDSQLNPSQSILSLSSK